MLQQLLQIQAFHRSSVSHKFEALSPRLAVTDSRVSTMESNAGQQSRNPAPPDQDSGGGHTGGHQDGRYR